MNKKIATLFPLLATALLASCGQKDESTSQVPSTEESSKPSTEESSEPSVKHFIDNETTIDFWYNGNDSSQEWLKSAAESFKASVEPNVTVKVTKSSGSFGDAAKAVTDGIAANNYPDIFVGYPDAGQDIINANKCLNLEPYINNAEYGLSAEEHDDYVEEFLEEGSNYAMPGVYSFSFCKSTEALYYNKQKLRDLVLPGVNNGLPIGDNYYNNLTWDEFFDVYCPALMAYNETLDDAHKLFTIAEKGSAILSYDSDENLFITLAEQYGYGYTSVDKVTGKAEILFNNQDMRDLMKKWNGYRNANYVCSELSAAKVRGNKLLAADNALFYIGSTGGVTYAQDAQKAGFEVGVAAIPQANLSARKVILQGPSLIFLKHPGKEGEKYDQDKALASWLFAKYITNYDHCVTWSYNTGYTPIRYSVYESAEWADYCDETQYETLDFERLQAATAAYVSTLSTDEYFTSPVFWGSSAARGQAGSLTGNILNLTKEEATDEKIADLFNTAYNNTKGKMPS